MGHACQAEGAGDEGPGRWSRTSSAGSRSGTFLMNPLLDADKKLVVCVIQRGFLHHFALPPPVYIRDVGLGDILVFLLQEGPPASMSQAAWHVLGAPQ